MTTNKQWRNIFSLFSHDATKLVIIKDISEEKINKEHQALNDWNRNIETTFVNGTSLRDHYRIKEWFDNGGCPNLNLEQLKTFWKEEFISKIKFEKAIKTEEEEIIINQFLSYMHQGALLNLGRNALFFSAFDKGYTIKSDSVKDVCLHFNVNENKIYITEDFTVDELYSGVGMSNAILLGNVKMTVHCESVAYFDENNVLTCNAKKLLLNHGAASPTIKIFDCNTILEIIRTALYNLSRLASQLFRSQKDTHNDKPQEESPPPTFKT